VGLGAVVDAFVVLVVPVVVVVKVVGIVAEPQQGSKVLESKIETN
jgi:hypothetical protein